MSNTELENSEQYNNFDLKHRITGAAVLLFFGALVLPWLLGPPSEASKIEQRSKEPSVSEIEPANIIDDKRLELEQSPTDNIEETVYISKITPLDAKGNRELIRAANEAARNTSLRGSSKQEEAKALADLVAEQASTLDTTGTDIENKADDQQEEIELIETGEQERLRREKDLQAALAAEIESQNAKPDKALTQTNVPAKATTAQISVGWVVQVGLFTEKNRSITLIEQLRQSGFEASSSIVDTNRGKNTGTRVWLGPFAKRAEAVNEKNRLKSKAGKDGFIRVYP